MKRLRQMVAQGSAEAALDLVVAAVPEFEASDEVRVWARRQSVPVVRQSGLPRSA
ncbi:MAG: hypothetical protein JNL48_09830 [Acidobacteria bacterium]|nr:hypothetical protein [Acidobacteriota bacterium]